MKSIYMITLPERIFHWLNAACFITLIVSGFDIHYAHNFTPLGSMEKAIQIHNACGIFLVGLFVCWAFYWIVTKRVRFFFLTERDSIGNLFKQAKFYLIGIFKGEPHPFHPSLDEKYNPLQKLTYLFGMGVLVTVQIGTGIYLYLTVTKWMHFESGPIYLWSYIHVGAAFLSTAFVIIHAYMATTGRTPLANFKAMVTGHHTLERE